MSENNAEEKRYSAEVAAKRLWDLSVIALIPFWGLQIYMGGLDKAKPFENADFSLSNMEDWGTDELFVVVAGVFISSLVAAAIAYPVGKYQRWWNEEEN